MTGCCSTQPVDGDVNGEGPCYLIRTICYAPSSNTHLSRHADIVLRYILVSLARFSQLRQAAIKCAVAVHMLPPVFAQQGMPVLFLPPPSPFPMMIQAQQMVELSSTATGGDRQPTGCLPPFSEWAATGSFLKRTRFPPPFIEMGSSRRSSL